MKNIHLITIAVIVSLALASCADSISDIENTYRHGVERAENAQTPEELSQITIDIRDELIDGAKGIGGDRKLTGDEMSRYNNARCAFEQAIEKRYHKLTGQYGVWRDAN